MIEMNGEGRYNLGLEVAEEKQVSQYILPRFINNFQSCIWGPFPTPRYIFGNR